VLLAILAVLVVGGATTAIILATKGSDDTGGGTTTSVPTSAAVTTGPTTSAPEPFPPLSSGPTEATGPDTSIQPTEPTSAPPTTTPQTTGPITSAETATTRSAPDTSSPSGDDAAEALAAAKTFVDAVNAGDVDAAKAASCEDFAALVTKTLIDGVKPMTITGSATVTDGTALVPITYKDSGETKDDTIPLTNETGPWLVCLPPTTPTSSPTVGSSTG
jgi:hypothetical protein